MELIYFIVITSWCVWLLYRNDVWRDKYNSAIGGLETAIEIGDKLEKDLTFTKSTILGLFNKPVYVSLSTDQVEQIAIMVSNRMKAQPDQWLN